MVTILEELQARTDESKKRFDEATKAYQIAQQTLAQAQHTFNVWNMALQAETREEQLRQTAAAEKQLPLPDPSPESALVTGNVSSEETGETVNKTDTVRDLLYKHPAGMTAIDIWRQVGETFKHRPYLYSVLKRLRDRDEVTIRRGKYYLKLATKVEELKQEQSVVH